MSRRGKETNTMQLATIPPSDINIEADNPEYVVNELVDSAIFKASKVFGQ